MTKKYAYFYCVEAHKEKALITISGMYVAPAPINNKKEYDFF